MNVLGSAAIVLSTDRADAVSRFAAIFGAPPLHEFQIDGRDLSVSVFPGVSVLAGPASALETVTGLRATVSATTTIDRNDFGVSFNAPIPGLKNAMLLSDAVAINLDVEAILQSDGSPS